MLNKKFLLLFTFYVSYVWFTSFGTSVLPAHFLAQHINLQQLMFGKVLAFLAQILLLITFTDLTAKISWRLALIFSFSYILLSITVYNSFQFYLASFVNGFGLFFFFIFYNIAHFENTPQVKRGHSSALMFIAPSMIGVVAPLLAGFLTQINLFVMWLVSFISFCISFYLIRLQENFRISYRIGAVMHEIKATRVFIFIEGVWEALVFGVIPIYTLYFIKTPLGYGTFLSYLALVSIVANFTLGRITDKLQKRTVFLYPLTIIMAGTTISFITVRSDITIWIVLTGIIQFLLPLFWNISTAMVIDAHSNLHLAIPGRELTLALGRIIGLIMAYLSFTVEKSPHYIFIVLGLILFVYPAKLFWNTKISKNYSYL
jgi:uncharacterized membrane protein YjfL (UPF0719 family)